MFIALIIAATGNSRTRETRRAWVPRILWIIEPGSEGASHGVWSGIARYTVDVPATFIRNHMARGGWNVHTPRTFKIDKPLVWIRRAASIFPWIQRPIIVGKKRAARINLASQHQSDDSSTVPRCGNSTLHATRHVFNPGFKVMKIILWSEVVWLWGFEMRLGSLAITLSNPCSSV